MFLRQSSAGCARRGFFQPRRGVVSAAASNSKRDLVLQGVGLFLLSPVPQSIASEPQASQELQQQESQELPPTAPGQLLLQDPRVFTYAFQSDVPCNLRVGPLSIFRQTAPFPRNAQRKRKRA